MTRYEWLEMQIANVKQDPAAYQDECMIWPYSKNPKGYGWIHWKDRYGRPMLAHRVAFDLYYESLPNNLALHTCDTPSCFNPLHIYDGTYWHNAMDRWERNPHYLFDPKLTPDDVKIIIRLLWTGKLTRQEIADRFGVTCGTITAIWNNNTWQHIPRNPTIAESAQEYAIHTLKQIVEKHGITWQPEYNEDIQSVINYLIYATLETQPRPAPSGPVAKGANGEKGNLEV